MVDFSDYGDVKRWLDAIKPVRRRREIAVALAARAALRVLPLLGRDLARGSPTHDEVLSDFIMPCLRAAALAWTAAKYPTHAMELDTATAAADAAQAHAPNDAARAAALAAADAAHAVDAVDAPLATRAAALAAADAGRAADVLLEVDAASVDAGLSGAELAEVSLWPGGTPDWAVDTWRTFKSVLLAMDRAWHVWTDWYDARLVGDVTQPPIKALEVARVAISDEVWWQGPAAVNAEIERLIKEHKTGEKDVDDKSANGAAIGGVTQNQTDFAPILATRATMRVLPLIVNDRDRVGDRDKSKFVFAIFRALAVAWARTQFPSAVGWHLSTSASRNLNAYSRGSAPAVRHVGNAASEAALAVANVGPEAAAHRASRALIEVRKAMRADPHFDSYGIVEHANSSDIRDIAPGARPNPIGQIELWAGRDPPPVIREQWEMLQEGLRFANEGWDVWIDWYEARLDGRLRPQEIELAYVQFIHNVSPNASAWEANSEIKRLIEQHQALQQRPAAFQFQVVDNKIDAQPNDARPIDAETAEDFYEEAKRKGQELRDRSKRAQVDENIRAHIDLLLSRLGASYADMRPGLMLSVLRSLESDVRAYDGDEGRKELSAAHLSNILDLTESVRDLCAIFPRSREIEAEAVSLALPLERLPELRATIESVVAKVNDSDGATDGGRNAVNASAENLAHQRSLAEEAKQSAYFLVDFANFTRAGVKHLKATGRTIGRELGGLGADGWRAIRRGAPKGIERGAAHAGKALVLGGVAALMHTLGSDIAAIGSMVAPYLPLHEMLEKMTSADSDAVASANSQDAEPDATHAPPRRVPKAQKPAPKLRRRRKT